jgi:hypothetical protein
MTDKPLVTVICATFNAREAVRLTFSSFRRYTPEPSIVVVADNGSIDGTLDDLRSIPWLTVISWEERWEMMRAESEGARAAVATLGDRLQGFEATLSARERNLLAALTEAATAPVDELERRQHAATLDWLASRVRTPFVLTLDSDVEFLEAGWLSRMIDLMTRDNLAALGVYEPGIPIGGVSGVCRGSSWMRTDPASTLHSAVVGEEECRGFGFRRRLAPHVLLLRTSVFRDLGLSFRGCTRIEDEEEWRLWSAGPDRHSMAAAELRKFRTVTIFDTGALLLEALERAGARWAALPPAITRMFVHLGHMSIAGIEAANPAGPPVHGEYPERLAYVRERLRTYSDQT